MANSFVTSEVSPSGVARIVLARSEKRNALTREFLQDLLRAVEAVNSDESIRLLLLEAEGPVFCAGMDLGEMQQRAGQPNAGEEWRQDTRVYRELLERLFHLPVPTLAIVRGPAIAGGLGLVLACDVVLAGETASFSLPEPKRGIAAAVVTPMLAYRIGRGAAHYLLLSGRSVSAQDALRFGLCHEVVPAEELPARRDELVDSLLTGSRSALAMTKRLLLDSSAASLKKELDAGMTTSAAARETEDAREGLAAFLEKRSPKWHPKSP